VAVATVLVACGRNSKTANLVIDSLLVKKFIRTGDSLYATKSSYTTFLKSMECYDSALQVAKGSNNIALIAVAVFAKGRAYDAINNNPQKTIDYYREAARLYATLPNKYIEALYIKHLLAHSYDKVNDSIHCITVLNELYNKILPKPDSLKQQMKFTAEMALVSTEVRNYKLAEEILTGLTKRAWIKNDSAEYDYLDHYYLTKARTEVFRDRNTKSLYLDSVESVFRKCRTLSDSMYYSSQLWNLYKNTEESERENYYLRINNTIFNRFNTPQAVREANEKLSRMETAAVEKEREIEQAQGKLHKKYIYLLGGLLFIISVLTLFLVKRNKEIRLKRNEAVVTSNKLQQKSLQNELLNKELHHRVKNNLQIVNSLLFMQFKDNDDNKMKAGLKQLQERIKSMALVHNKLYQSDNTVHVYIKEYIKDLAGDILKTNIPAGKSIQLHIEENEAVNLSLDTSVSLGLILNELITNACKYAFTGKENGHINIEINRQGSCYQLVVKDDGGGLADDFHKKNSMGLRLVTNLSKQLGGAAKFENNRGTVVTINFVDAVAA
jgi:two-component sensor histidine kinase